MNDMTPEQEEPRRAHQTQAATWSGTMGTTGATTSAQPSHAATGSMPTAQRTRDRGCPACGETITSYPCGNCTWEPGLKVVQRTETPEGTEYTFVQERRSKFRAMAGFLALVLGVMLVAYAISGAGGGGGIALGVIFGPLVFAAGIMTIKLTRAGKVWWGLSSQEKAIAVPGLIAGTFMGVIVFWAVLGAWFIWSLSAGTARDVMRQV